LTIEVEIKEIKEMLEALHKKLDALVEDSETLAMMNLSQKALKDFLTSEPDLYSVRDVKVSYR
jgi:hypothetical protein